MAKGAKRQPKQKAQDKPADPPPFVENAVAVDPALAITESIPVPPPAVVLASEPAAIVSIEESQQGVPGGWSGAQDDGATGADDGWGAGASGGDWGASADAAGDLWGGGAQTNDLDWGTSGGAAVGGWDDQAASAAPPAEPTKKEKKSKKAAAAAAAASAPPAATFAGLPANFGAPPGTISLASQSPAVKAASGWGVNEGGANGSPAAKADDDAGDWTPATAAGGDGAWRDPSGGAQSTYAWPVPSSAAAAAHPPPPAPPPMQAPTTSTQSHGATAGGWRNWANEARGLSANLKVTTASASASPLPPPPPSAPPSSILPLAAAAPQKDRPAMSPEQQTDRLRSLLTHPSSSHAKSAPPQPQHPTYMSSPAAMDRRQQAALYQQAAAAIGRQLPHHQQKQQQPSLVQQQASLARQQAEQVLQQRIARAHQQQQPQHGGGKSSKPSAQPIQQSDSWGNAGWGGGGWNTDPIPEEDEEEYEDDDGWGEEEEEEEEEDDRGEQDGYGYGWGVGKQAADWGQAAQPSSGYGQRVRFSPTISYQAEYPGSRAPPPAPAPPGPAPAAFHPSTAARPPTAYHPSAGQPNPYHPSAGQPNPYQPPAGQPGPYHPSAAPPSVSATPAAYQPALWSNATNPSPSKTFAMASGLPRTTQTTVFELQPPRNGLGENSFATSHGHALMPAERALFSRDRPVRQRIRWSFNPDKDPRVSSLLKWVTAMSNGLATIGLQRFLETGERGALVANADYRVPGTAQPAFDWVTMGQLQNTLDRVLQESVTLYDPAEQVIVFVFLLSNSGNSMAVWRRKLSVPEALRETHDEDIQATKAELEADYPVYVDELAPPAEPPKKKRNFLSKLKWRRKEKEQAKS